MSKKRYLLALGLIIISITVVIFAHLKYDNAQTEPTADKEPEQKIEYTTPTPEAMQTPIEATTTPTVVEKRNDQAETKTIDIPTETVSLPTPTIVKATARFDTTTMLLAHNTARAEVGVPPLMWSEKLSKSAQVWSDTLKAEKCEFRHDPDTDYGENIYWAWRIRDDNTSLISKPEDALDWWVNEVNFYNYDKNTCKDGEQCGHYTQVVWKETREVGCSVSTCFDDGKQTDVWVCRYNPVGNNGMRPY